MVEISKADWKLFRERVPEWQQHYMEQLTKKYIEMLSSPGNASDHFWELEKRIKNDKKHPGVMLEINKSEAIWDIAIFIKKKVITLKDLEGFSEDLIDSVTEIINRQKDGRTRKRIRFKFRVDYDAEDGGKVLLNENDVETVCLLTHS